MSDAPGRVAAVPPIAVVVDLPIVHDWVSASLSALADDQPQMMVVAAPAKTGRLRRELDSGGRDVVDELPVEVVRLATLDDLDAAVRDAGIVVDLSRTGAARAQGEQTVLTVWHGATPATSPLALVRELAAGRQTLTTTVAATDASAGRTVVAAARVGLNRSSLSRSRERASAKIPGLLLRGVDGVRRPGGPKAFPAAGGRIGAAAVLGGATRLAGAAARSLVDSLTRTANYEVAWGDRNPADPSTLLPRQMHWVDHPRDRFLADPFLARDGGKTFVFAEDYSRRNGYATIGVFDPRDPAATFRTVLDRGTHVSYPFVFRDEETGDWLMLPETAAEQRVTLFRASSFPDEWQEDTVLLDGVRAYDPTIVLRDGMYWLFYAAGPTRSAPNDELHLAFSKSLRGPYAAHPWNPVKSDVVGSRPAGRLFDWNGRLIRPAQDSSREYGYAVVFHEVTVLTPTTFAEEPLARLEPDWAPLIRGTHSWDFLDDIVVTDAKRLRPRYAGIRFTPSRSR